MSGDIRSHVERLLADKFERAYCILTGSGTTALYCLFQSIIDMKGRASDVSEGVTLSNRPGVLFPNITCETAVNAAIFAGLRPEFADVSTDSLAMTAETAQPSLATKDIVAVVPTHIFGYLSELAELRRLLPEELAIIEDAAQAYGGRIGSKWAGSMGDASILSFGEGKILDCGAGGAVLTNDPDMAGACREMLSSVGTTEAAASEARRQVMTEMMEARRAYRAAGDRTAHITAQFDVLRRHKSGYLSTCSEDTATQIAGCVPNLDGISEARRQTAARIDEVLDSRPSTQIINRAGEPALWRYTFRVTDESRDELLTVLRRSGVEASKLFPPCTKKFSLSGHAPGTSAEVSDSLVNLTLPSSNEDKDRLIDALQEAIA